MRFLTFILFFFCACSSVNIDAFSSQKWKTDEKGCLGYREDVVKALLDNEQVFVSKPKRFIHKILGQPNSVWKREEVEYYGYFTTPSFQCGNSNYTIDSLDISKLVISFRNNKVIEVGCMIP